ncbi:MAG: YeeE/YedE family protein [Magnetospirillum sp.]|nr:YeeE/YedE family protein [Magnetospirillum sp.]
MSDLPITTIVGGAGFLAGGIFGAVANRTHFCTMGAISDIVFMDDWRRMRSWLLAIAVAILATQAMNTAGLIDTGKSIYLTPNLGWLGAIVGGLLFGFGMTMAGGCGNKTLVRIGGGNLKSVVVLLVIGIFAYMTLRGLIAVGRVQMEAAANINLANRGLTSQGLPDMLAAITGLAPTAAHWAIAAPLAGALLLFCFADRDFRTSPANLIAGLVVGLMVPTGWWITGVLGNDDFSPTALASFTFIAPIGDSVEYLMTYSGATINFGIATVGGVIAGSFVMAVASSTFRFEGFTDTADTMRHLIGAAIMGVGGVLALGCTIGQGLTGMSTLAAGSLLALLSILTGGVLGLKYLEQGSLGGALRAVLVRG